MNEKRGSMSQEKVLEQKIESMNFQIQWIQQQKNKIVKSFQQLGLEDTIVAFDLMFQGYQEQLNKRLQEAQGNQKMIVDAYQMYIDEASNGLVSAVESFKEFGVCVQNDVPNSNHHR